MFRLMTVLCFLFASILPACAMAQPTTPGAKNVEPFVFPCQDTTCDGELWLPVTSDEAVKPPVIVMAHGFGALRTWGLAPFAERFVNAGFAVMQFDYRGFGKSGGLPRRVVDGKAHVEDWLDALDAIAQHPSIDPERIGIWGVSFSGGQALVVGAERPQQVKAVSAMVPFVSGFSSGLQYPVKYHPQAIWNGLLDLFCFDDEDPVYVPMVSPDGFAALVCDECYEGYKGLLPSDAPNTVAARVFFSLPFWFPGSYAEDIVAPTLIIDAENDGVIPVEKLRDVAASVPNGEYIELAGAHHFSPNSGPVFEEVVAQQTQFFVTHLKP